MKARRERNLARFVTWNPPWNAGTEPSMCFGVAMAPDALACHDCGLPAPFEPSGEVVLTREGWRLSRRIEAGALLLEWRCPSCARVRRKSALELQATLPPDDKGRGED